MRVFLTWILCLFLLPVSAFAASDAGAKFAVAIEKGDVEAVQALVEGGASADTPIEYGEHSITPLMKACWEGYPEIIAYLIKAGANVNATNKDGETPLINAIRRSRVEVAQTLIEAGAKVNTKDVREFTPMTTAAAAGDLEMVELLAKSGADLTTETYGLTPLSFAASAGNVDMIRLLVKLGAPVNYASKGGDSGSTALFNAIYSGKMEAVQALLELKASVNVKTKSGDTPMKAAQKGDQEEMMALLQKSGAKGGAPTLTSKAAPVSKVEAEPTDNAPSAPDPAKKDQARKTLQAKGVDISNLNAAMWSALDQNNAELAQLLADAGADVNHKGSYGESMTLRVAGSGRMDLLRILINAGADVSAENEYQIGPLAAAAEQGHKDIVAALIQAGAKVNARNNYGGTALQVAVLRGYADIVKMLIAAGADVQRDRKDLIEIAQREKHAEVEKLIREAPAKKK